MARELKEEINPAATPEAPDLSVNQQGPLIVPSLSGQRVAVEVVLADFEAAKTARDQRDYGMDSKGTKLSFDTWLKELRRLYYGHREPKTVPWKYCSNRSMMIAMAILEVLHARLFPAVYNEELTRWRPAEMNDMEKAERVEKFMYWWVRVRASLREFFDRWVRVTVGFGETLSVSSWDIRLLDKGEMAESPPMQDPMTGEVIPVPPQKVLERFETSRSDIINLEDVFLQPGAGDIQRDTVVIRRTYLYRDLEDMERDGKVVNVSESSASGVPTLKSFLPQPSSATEGVDANLAEELANVRRRNIPVECLEWYGGIDLDADGYPEQVRGLIIPQYKVYLGAVAIKDLSKRGQRHLDYTQYMPRIDEPGSLHGLGILEQIKEIALEIDAIANQMTDAHSLSILRPFFYDPSGDLDPGAMTLKPNTGVPVNNPNQNVFFPEINIQTEKLINAIKLGLEFIERLTAASSYIMGKESEIVGGSGTATRTQEIVNAAGARHAIPVGRLRAGAARILTHHLDLVQTNFPPGLETRVLGDKGELIFDEQDPLTAEGISGELDAYLLPDESLGSRETERQLAVFLWQILSQSVIVATDPTKQYRALADVLKAFGKEPELYLGIAPDVKQTDRPEDENTLIFQGDFASVKASVLDNPIEHIMVHQAALQDPLFMMFPPEQQQTVAAFLQAHIQEHMQVMQLLVAQAGKQGGSGATNGNQRGGAQGGSPRAANTPGAEPGMGAAPDAASRVQQTQRSGESQPATNGGG